MEQNPAYKHSYISAYSSVVEQWPSKPSVSGSSPLKRIWFKNKDFETETYPVNSSNRTCPCLPL